MTSEGVEIEQYNGDILILRCINGNLSDMKFNDGFCCCAQTHDDSPVWSQSHLPIDPTNL